MKLKKKIAALLILTMLSVYGIPVVAFAEWNNTQKEEVAYINLDGNGVVKEIRMVNIFDLKQDERIIDYGNYETVRNMTTTDEIELEEDTVIIDAKAGKLYYEGKLYSNEMPWNVVISYEMDGQTYTASEIAGKTGKLEITMDISQNPACKGDWFDNYALQATFLLDSESCSNIVAEDATVANVGQDKQITYTILPGKGIHTVITADVDNFEMDAVSINGIHLNIDVDVDDSEIHDKINELMDATKEVRDGAADLASGTGELKDGASTLMDGTEELQSGAKELNDGAKELESGIQKVKDGLVELKGKSGELTSGSADVLEALKKMQSALGDVEVNANQMEELVDGSELIWENLNKLEKASEELQQAVNYAAYEAKMNQGLAPYDMTMVKLKAGNAEMAQGLSNLSISETEISLQNTITLLTMVSRDPRYTTGAALQYVLGAKQELTHLQNQLTALEQQKQQLQTVATQAAGLFQMNNAVMNGTETYLNAVNENIVTMHKAHTKLCNAYLDFHLAIRELQDKVEELADGMKELQKGIDTLVTEYGKLDDGIGAYTDGVASLEEGYGELVSGAADLAKGCKELLEGADELYDGATSLLDGVTELADGSNELADGTAEMHDKTGDMDNQVQDRIDDLTNSIGGTDEAPVSFASDLNGKIKSLQFVIRTEAVEISDTPVVAEVTNVKLTWWQKLLKLFGLWK